MSLSLKKTPRWVELCAVALCLCACSPPDELGFERSIGAPRSVKSDEAEPRLFASSAERFGSFTPGTRNAAAFDYVVPPGWSEVAPTELRAVNLKVGERDGMECYVTVLAGEGGGALANVNRWCGQIKAASWTQADLDRAPRITMFGAEAVIVELVEAGGERALLGALARLESRAVFVKFTAAPTDVREQRGAFEAFCKSLVKKP